MTLHLLRGSKLYVWNSEKNNAKLVSGAIWVVLGNDLRPEVGSGLRLAGLVLLAAAAAATLGYYGL